MSSIAEIKAHYNFTSGDADNLVKLRAVMQRRSDEFVAEFYTHIRRFANTDKFLKDETTVKKHQDALKMWFAGLFSGDYGERYFVELEKVGAAHVKINLPAHYVNASVHFVRLYAVSVINKEVIASDESAYMQRSLEKILDINLDVFTSSYIAEEEKVFLSSKVESTLIQMANRFSHGLNIILVLGLVVLGAITIVLIGYDLLHILDGDLEKGLLATLGGLLMLWLVIELMDTEIKHLKGGKFAIKVFISVALVAFIRKILIMSLKSGETQAQLSLIAAIAVLGGVYWLVSKVKD
ncbi:MAG: phosphate-starvation-inducible PsiE family protein [Deltaproteobacteria bacterium]|nr:phosphate-starvation-inducible PsiE family protein [Deltaproteobacteria bacterium]